MNDQFLYEELDTLLKHGAIKKEIPSFLIDNLNAKLKLRPYQEEAFARFFYCFEKGLSAGNKQKSHFLFNMATGSGKTLIMTGLILYLYKKGYRNFLFFVDNKNIIEKTKQNFLNPKSQKYLFKESLIFDQKRVSILPAQNFEDANTDHINIVFTTMQKLHADLTNVKENALNFEDFKDKKLVLLSDEAHHINATTKKQRDWTSNEKTWEDTVEKIFNQNKNNLLLEFTATLNYNNTDIVNKYKDKTLYRYDLKKFHNQAWSKDVFIVQSDFEQRDRLLQALVLNQYKQEVATKYHIRLKPVILFKAQRTIAQSQENKKAFHQMIESLTHKNIEKIQNKSDLLIVKKAFRFFKKQGISNSQLAKRLKEEFQESSCLCVNEEAEKEKHQILLNSLEDEDNPIRAIFAVDKLNEGWDVLNLFDIVRCYEKRDSGKGKIGTITMKEAQLIGRGARYFPFVLKARKSDRAKGLENGSTADKKLLEDTDYYGIADHYDNPYKRKFDKDLGHELRVLEELNYHSINDNKYLSEIKTALIQAGIMEETQSTKQLELKDQFKKTDFYKQGLIYLNKKVKRRYNKTKSLFDMGVSKTNLSYKTATGRGNVTQALLNPPAPFHGPPYQGGKSAHKVISESDQYELEGMEGSETIPIKEIKNSQASQSQERKLQDIDCSIIQNAILRNDFFTFKSLKTYFPYLQSIKEFITSSQYLGALAITFEGEKPSRKDLLDGVSNLLEKIQNEMRENITEYQGTEQFKKHLIRDIFKNKEIKPPALKTEDSETFTKQKDWYVFKAFYGTSEEKAFIKMLESQITKLKKTYHEIYLIRNERHFKIHNFKDGRGFEPDFVLFLKEKSGKMLTYQMFIEPKGKHLKEHDKWKEDFLKSLRKRFKGQSLDFITGAKSQNYRLTATPFYNSEEENQFKKELYSALE